ncbi:MAG: hypothetical protein JXR30_01825 [Alphaproteobacteria bacterium]|nr:hypothetical protein [Alphaproteobacteria bacterium]
MKKIILSALAVLALVGCDDSATSSCEARMQGVKNPAKACECMENAIKGQGMSLSEYMTMGEKMGEKEVGMEALLNPSPEMKTFMKAGFAIAQKCSVLLQDENE